MSILRRVVVRPATAAGRLCRDETGAIAIMSALLLVVVCGAVGLGIDMGMWYRTERAAQNAADAAAIAAAMDGSATYATTGKAVAATYGFVDGSDGATVSVVSNQTCPGGSPTTCYKASVTQVAPVFFSGVLGVHAPVLASSTLVNPTSGPEIHSYCLVALGNSGTSPAVLANGVPKADLTGCSVYSGNDMTCHGHDLGATYGDAVGTDSGCGATGINDVPTINDPYSSLASNIPTNTCASYPQEPTKRQDPALPATNLWSGAKTLPATQSICGDLQLTGDVTLTTTSPGSLLVIYNGQLDTNGYTLQTASGSALTIIFSGSNGSYTHAPTGGGTLNFRAPSSGTWSGIAIYQDPALTSGVNISAAGNSPTWDITGVVYLPHASVTFSGAVNKSNNGADCFVLVVDNVTFNGTGSILDHGGCTTAGATMPIDNVPGAPALVQ
jgi:Flp pilus assembly protein TadG